jgi:hypothetical protein
MPESAYWMGRLQTLLEPATYATRLDSQTTLVDFVACRLEGRCYGFERPLGACLPVANSQCALTRHIVDMNDAARRGISLRRNFIFLETVEPTCLPTNDAPVGLSASTGAVRWERALSSCIILIAMFAPSLGHVRLSWQPYYCHCFCERRRAMQNLETTPPTFSNATT